MLQSGLALPHIRCLFSESAASLSDCTLFLKKPKVSSIDA